MQLVPVESQRARNGLRGMSSGRVHNLAAGKFQRGSLDGTLRVLDAPAGMSKDQLDSVGLRLSKEARFVMGRAALRMPGALRIGQIRLASVAEANLLAVVEWLDPRIAAVPGASPRAEQKGERLKSGVERR